MFCPNCGKQNPDGSKFCQFCGASLEARPQQPPQYPAPPYAGAAPQPNHPAEKKNVAALILGIIGAICGFVGAVLWASCADFVYNCEGSIAEGLGNPAGGGTVIYTVLFVVLGIGGAVLSLIGSIQAFNYARGRLILSLLGFFFGAGCLAVECVMIGTFAFLTSGFTIIAVVLLLVETILSGLKKPQPQNR